MRQASKHSSNGLYTPLEGSVVPEAIFNKYPRIYPPIFKNE